VLLALAGNAQDFGMDNLARPERSYPDVFPISVSRPDGPAGTNASASSGPPFQIPQAWPSRQVVRRLDVGCEADRLKRLDEPPAEINLSGK